MSGIDGLAAYRRRWLAIPKLVRTAVKAEMEKQATQLVREMVSAAPKDQLDLANSIGWTWGAPPAGALAVGSFGGDSGMRITIYAGGTQGTARRQSRGPRSSAFFDTDNAKFQEFGTANMPANPFFFPIWRARKRRVKSAITRAITRAIKSA